VLMSTEEMTSRIKAQMTRARREESMMGWAGRDKV